MIFDRVLILILVAVLAVQCATLRSLIGESGPDGTTISQGHGTTAPETTAPPATEPGPEETTVPTDPYKTYAQTILGDMTLEEKIWQLFVVDIDLLTGEDGTTISGDKTRKAIEKKPVGGVIYFGDNLKGRDQTDAMIRNLQSYANLQMFIAVDEEGGTVTRLSHNASMGVTDFGDMYDVGEEGNVSEAYNVGATLGEQLRELGINLDFAPVADVWTNPENTVIGKRAFSNDPSVAADMVQACVKGFVDQKTLCTLKHFPGHGDTKDDSHEGSASSDKTLEELRACELLPFLRGIESGAPMVMMGHIKLPNVPGAEDVPATLSKEIVTDLLRNELGFEGLIITDAMNMGAIKNEYDSDEAALMAIEAGVDLILMPNNMDVAFNGIFDAVESGDFSEERINESVLRILETKIRYGIIKMAED